MLARGSIGEFIIVASKIMPNFEATSEGRKVKGGITKRRIMASDREPKS